jgi:hypothetical protein
VTLLELLALGHTRVQHASWRDAGGQYLHVMQWPAPRARAPRARVLRRGESALERNVWEVVALFALDDRWHPYKGQRTPDDE